MSGYQTLSSLATDPLVCLIHCSYMYVCTIDQLEVQEKFKIKLFSHLHYILFDLNYKLTSNFMKIILLCIAWSENLIFLLKEWTVVHTEVYMHSAWKSVVSQTCDSC